MDAPAYVCHAICKAELTNEIHDFEILPTADLCAFEPGRVLTWCSGMSQCRTFCSNAIKAAEEQCPQFNYLPDNRAYIYKEDLYRKQILIKFHLHNIKCAEDINF